MGLTTNTGSVKLNVNGAERMRIINNGFVGIGITNPFAPLCIGTPASASDGSLVISKNSGGNRNFKMGYDGSFNFCMGDFGNGVSGNTWRSTDLSIAYLNGNVGIGLAPTKIRS